VRPDQMRMLDTFPLVLTIPHVPEIADRLTTERVCKENAQSPADCQGQNDVGCAAKVLVRKEAEEEEEHGNLGECDRRDVEEFLNIV